MSTKACVRSPRGFAVTGSSGSAFPVILAFAVSLFGSTPGVAAADTPLEAEFACSAPEAREFDFWIGEWDVGNRHRNPQSPDDPTWFDTGAATNRVYAALDGCVIIEHWMGRLSFANIHGFSVRAFDPLKEKWVLVLLWPRATGGSFAELEGKFRHGRGEFFGAFTNSAGQHVENRYTFSDIGPRSFRWDSATSDDGRVSWKPGWIMEFTRRDALRDRALFNGPALTPAWCSTPEHRAFDFSAGEWIGTDGETAITVRAYPILQGCALMEFMKVEAAPRAYRRFRVRAYDAGQQKWVQYAIDNREPVFERLEGAFEDGAVTLSTPAEAATARHRESWSRTDEDNVLWKRERSADKGGPWVMISEVEFTKQH